MAPSITSNGHGGSADQIPALDQRTVAPLGMTGPQFRDAAMTAIDEIEKYYANMSDRPVIPSVEPGYLRKLLPTTAPDQGEDWHDIERDIGSKIMPGMTHWQHPRFMAFFPSSSTFPGMIGELWSAALTAPAFNWICSPVVTELETIVMDWLAQIMALPEVFLSHGTGGGVIQGSASEAGVTVMVAARERCIRRHIEREGLTDPDEIEDRSCEIRSRLVALGSDQAHSMTQKASNIAGTRFRVIPTSKSDSFALNGAQLRAQLEALTAKNLIPYYLTVSIGATSVNAIDDIASIAIVARDYPDLWLHCDAAYAGAALVCPEYHHLSRTLAAVDSLDLNLHKWLLTNFDASCLFVRDRRDLTDALSITPPFLRNQFTATGLVTDYRDWQIPLGRRFRALKVWFVLRTWGVAGLREHIRFHVRLGELFAGLVRSKPDLFVLVDPTPAFALTVFTVRAPGDAEPGASKHSVSNRLTAEVYRRVEERKRFFLTSTVVGGEFAIRVVSANPLAEEKYVRKLFEELVETTEQVLATSDETTVSDGK